MGTGKIARSSNIPGYLIEAINKHPIQSDESFECTDGVSWERFSQNIPHERVGSNVVVSTNDHTIWQVVDGQVYRVREASEIEEALKVLANKKIN